MIASLQALLKQATRRRLRIRAGLVIAQPSADRRGAPRRPTAAGGAAGADSPYCRWRDEHARHGKRRSESHLREALRPRYRAAKLINLFTAERASLRNRAISGFPAAGDLR